MVFGTIGARTENSRSLSCGRGLVSLFAPIFGGLSPAFSTLYLQNCSFDTTMMHFHLLYGSALLNATKVTLSQAPRKVQ
eukprot:scaffold7105_cov153-Skeletonema_dohrnii-CCMP3373.AAC.2